ncbi:hypothetical protein ACU42Y_08620 [Proteus mirabilis]
MRLHVIHKWLIVCFDKIHLKGERYWSLPTILSHLDKCVVFYHTTNSQAEVSYLAHKKQLYSSAQTDIYVCVFVSGMVLTSKKRWGLSLYSEDGARVFNTDYLPFTEENQWHCYYGRGV